MKKGILTILAVCMLLTMLPISAMATEVTAAEQTENRCGEDLSWHYADGTLTVSGSGAMDDYEEGTEPWREYKDSITDVIFAGDITYIGAYAFKNYDRLQTVEFGDALHTIGEQAFKSCDILQSVILPASFRCFGKECFMGCKQLLEVWCRGGMPSFKGSCLWDTGATVYYPPNNAWPMDAVWQVLSSYQNKILIQGGYAPEKETPVEVVAVETEPAVEETEPEQTQPAAEPEETVPETTVPETTVPETVAVTETDETVPQITETEPALPDWLVETEATEPQTEQRDASGGRGMMVFGVIIGVVILFILVGAVAFRRRSY